MPITLWKFHWLIWAKWNCIDFHTFSPNSNMHPPYPIHHLCITSQPQSSTADMLMQNKFKSRSSSVYSPAKQLLVMWSTISFSFTVPCHGISNIGCWHTYVVVFGWIGGYRVLNVCLYCIIPCHEYSQWGSDFLCRLNEILNSGLDTLYSIYLCDTMFWLLL